MTQQSGREGDGEEIGEMHRETEACTEETEHQGVLESLAGQLKSRGELCATFGARG